MRRRRDTTWLWNTGQGKQNYFSLFFVFLCFHQVCARPDFIDSMSKQFFGFMSDENRQPQQQQQQQYQPTPDPFAQMFGAASQQVGHRSPNQNYQSHNQHRPHRQGYYAPPHPQVHHVQQQVPPLPYNGPPPVYGQQQGFGQRQPNQNETRTDGYPPDNTKHHHPYPPQHRQQVAHYPPVEYQHQHHQVVEYPKTPETVVEYQTPYDHQAPQSVEYHHLPPQTAIVEEHHAPAIEIHSGHHHHEPPTHVEYHHPHEEEHHHYPTHKPKRFHLSFHQTPDLKIIDKHLKLPPVKFRFHINPKIVITSNTKDPLDKKHHDHEHDLEPFPPPDAFSDHNAPPSYNEHTIEHYTPKHHYPVSHHAVSHYPVEHHAVAYPEAKHAYPVGHHQPGQEFVYDLSHGHSHVDPHRSLGHYEPTFKVIQKATIITEPPPTPPTTTTRAPTTTARTTTTTRATTTTRPTRRARISARNPAFSVAFTEGSTSSTTAASVSSSTTTRRTTFRESESDVIARRDELPTSSELPQSTVTKLTSTTTSTTTTPQSTSSSTTREPTTTTTTTTTTTSTTPKPTTTTTTTTPEPTTTTTTTPRPTTTTTTTTTRPTTSTSATTARQPESRSRVTPAEETTPHTTTLNVDSNEIDMRKNTEAPRRRPEPLQDGSSPVDRSESFNLEGSESVKVIETNMLIDGKNQTVRFYYITQPVKLPLDVFQKMTGQGNSGVNVVKIRDKRHALDVNSVLNHEMEELHNL